MIYELPRKVQRFIHLYLTGQYTNVKIAELLDIHPNTIYAWMSRDDVKECLAQMQKVQHEMVSTQMQSMTLKAMERLNSLIDSPIDGVALNAVNTLLDRTGHKQAQKIEKNVTVRTFEEKLNSLADATIEDAEIVDGDDEYEDE